MKDGGEEWHAVEKIQTGRSVQHVLNQWDALCYYRDDGLAEATITQRKERFVQSVSERKITCLR